MMIYGAEQESIFANKKTDKQTDSVYLALIQRFAKQRDLVLFQRFDFPRSLIPDEKGEGSAADLQRVFHRVVKTAGSGHVGPHKLVTGNGSGRIAEGSGFAFRDVDFFALKLSLVAGTFRK